IGLDDDGFKPLRVQRRQDLLLRIAFGDHLTDIVERHPTTLEWNGDGSVPAWHSLRLIVYPGSGGGELLYRLPTPPPADAYTLRVALCESSPRFFCGAVA